MNINRTNEAGPSRQPTNEGDEAASTSLPIVAVQQAGAEGVLTTHAPSDQAGVPARECVIVQPARVPEPPIANPNQAPEQNTGAHFRPWMAADPIRRPQASAGVRHHPYAPFIFRSDVLTGSSRLAYPYFLFIQDRPFQPAQRPAFAPEAQAGPSRLHQPYVPFEPSGPPQVDPRPAFDPEVQAGPSRRRPDYVPQAPRGEIPDYALAGPSTAPKPYAPACLMYGRLAGDAYPEGIKQRAIAIYKECNNCSDVCKQLKKEFPARAPAARTIAKWIRDHKQSERLREVEREENNETSDND